jgi:hypothetical protein
MPALHSTRTKSISGHLYGEDEKGRVVVGGPGGREGEANGGLDTKISRVVKKRDRKESVGVAISQMRIGAH